MIPRKVSLASTLVRAASPTAVEERLNAVADELRRRKRKRWLGYRHPYNGNIVKRLERKDDISGSKLGEYIACSAPLHLADGWNYLSRAFDAACRGDRNSAYHLAYYGELRGAMSLLATEGIGIFNRRHIALNQTLEPTELKRSRRKGTHRATWLLLSAWSRELGRSERLLRAITIESKSLSDWLAAVGIVEPYRAFVARRWLSSWSVDIRILSADPRRRNEISYRPSRIRSQPYQPVNSRLELATPVFDSWEELQPGISSGSAALDLSLLRHALMLAIEEGEGNFDSYQEALTSLRHEMSDHTYQVLSVGSESAARIFREAEISSSQGKAATPILARALLMLRLASASTASLLSSAGLSRSDLEFWWSPLGSDLGLWDNPADVEDFSDLWTDVAEARDEADAEISAVKGESSVRVVSQTLARDVSLTQFSRVPMWLLSIE